MTLDRNQPSERDGESADHYVHDIDPALLAEKIPDDVRPLTFANVTKRYGTLLAVDDITFEVQTGEFHCLAGPNGSGKTTLGKIAVGLTRPTNGDVIVPAHPIGFGFQEPSFYTDLTVTENVDVFCTTAGISPRCDWVRTIMSTLRLTHVEQQVAGELSGGFKKKLDLAIALLDAPPYLWLDEPLSDIDDISQRRVVSLLEAYVNAGGGVVASTHNLDAFEGILTHLTVFLDGRKSETIALSESQRPASAESLYQELLDDLASTIGQR